MVCAVVRATEERAGTMLRFLVTSGSSAGPCAIINQNKKAGPGTHVGGVDREAENESDLEHTKLQISVHPGRDYTSRKLVTIGGRLWKGQNIILLGYASVFNLQQNSGAYDTCA